MLLVLDNEKSVINKEMVSSTKEISYPFFDNAKIDNYITNYLDDYKDNEKDNILIDYDYYDKDNMYYLTFYKYILENGKVNSNSDSFFINMNDNIVNKIDNTVYEFDFVIGRNVDSDKKLVALTFDDGPNYNTSKVINMESMFQDCKSLEFLSGISKWNISNVKNMKYMFKNCDKLRNIPKWYKDK